MRKRIVSLLMTILIIATMLPVQALAAELANSSKATEDEIVLEEETAMPPEEDEPEEAPQEELPMEQPEDSEPAEQPTNELAGSSTAMTSATIVASGYCGGEGDGTNLTWTLDSDGLLTISGKGEMGNYSSESTPWYNIRTSIKKVNIKVGVASIGKYSFYGCTSLTIATIPNSVTSIGSDAFFGCMSLTSIVIPGSVTSIGAYAFWGCTSMTAITIPSSITSIGAATFRDCTSMTAITIPDSVISIGNYAFDGCTSLTTITIPGSMTSIGDGTFWGCTRLASIIIPSSVTSIGGLAFNGCTSLTDVYYTGSETEWNIIQVHSGNTCLTSATMHYNNAAPVVDGAADAETYIKQHSDFAHNDFSSFRNANGFYRTVWQEEDGKRLWACYTWDIIGDIGEVITLRFDDLTISADYYEMFLSDLVLHMAESETTERWGTKAAETYNKYYKQTQKGVFSSMINAIEDTPELLEQAEKDVGSTWKSTLETEFYKQFENEDYELSGTPRVLFDKAFDKILKDDTVYKSVFEGLDTASEYISDFVDAGNLIYDLVNCYSSAKALSATNQEMFAILYDAAAEMAKIDPQYAEWFRKPLDEFYSAATNDTELLIALKDTYFKTGNFVYETFLRTAFKETVYQFVATEVLHLSAAVGTAYLKAVVAAYTGTYAIMDLVLKNSSKSEQYKYMNYIAPFEQALSNATFVYGADLVLTQKTYAQARKFDTAYKMLAYTNQFLYECAYTFDKLTHHKEELPYATMYKNRWDVTKCHGSIRLSGGKYVSALCPVDVYLYDESNSLVLAVVNEEITVNTDPSITAIVYDGAKSFAYPDDRDYRVEIIAREEGTMDYVVAEATNDTEFREVEFYNVPLESEQKYSGEVPAELNLPSTTYSLTTNEKVIECSYDSQSDDAAACASGQHAYGEWIEKQVATARDEGVKERFCANCGKREFEILPRLACDHKGSETVSSCTEAAICSICGEPMALMPHVDENGDNKCDVCGAAVIRGDVNGDGIIDVYDLQSLYEYCCDIGSLTGNPFPCADVNQDTKISILDVQMLYAYLTTGKWTYPQT